MNKC